MSRFAPRAAVSGPPRALSGLARALSGLARAVAGLPRAVLTAVGGTVAAGVALALPPRCPGCGVPVAADHRFCAACWGRLRLIGPPWCATCNTPFVVPHGADMRCGACLADPPRHAGVRAAVAYGPIARQLALQLKYGRRIGVATTMAQRIAPLVPPDIDLLVPVPLQRWRLWSRGYNQAGLIAAALHRLTGLPHDPFALIRGHGSRGLRGLGRRARARAVRGAFAVPHRARIAGRRIGLVDDVYTTGATAAACTTALLAAGAASVTILCWARVLDDESLDD